MHNRHHVVLTVSLNLLLASLASAQHAGDVLLLVEDNRIVTGTVDDGEIHSPHRVWEEHLDGDPPITDDPGYDALPGTFPPNVTVGLSIRKALRVWHEAESHFLDIASPERMEVSRFAQVIFTPKDDPKPDDPLPSLALGSTSSNGSLHTHVWYELTSPYGDGIYLLELEVSAGPGAGGIETSDPFWIVFNRNRPDDMAHEAVEWVEKHLIGAECPADMNDDGEVDVLDLLILLDAWGACPRFEECPADLNGDGTVDVLDLLQLLDAWGSCP
jgi:hypothetical protein